MSQKKVAREPIKVVERKDEVKESWFPKGNEAAVIPFPWLWLALAAFFIYCPTLKFGFTELDDSIFIRDFREYNENVRHIFTSFGRGLFDATKDPYYRPIFLDSMVLNYQFAKDEIAGYHWVNVLLHITSVILLYKLLVKLKVRELHAFILCLIFAVHPVISQAVAWIPGRNDTLLTVFTLPFLIHTVKYAEEHKNKNLAWSVLFLLLAFFTKETAVFVPPVAFVLVVFAMQKKWLAKENLILYGTWAAVFVTWFAARKMATIQNSPFTDPGKVVGDFFHRVPLVIQYLGKIFLPVNLSVFPIQDDTVYYFGFIAIAIVAALLYFSKEVNWRTVGIGFGLFILFLVPALLVPNDLNGQTFEHRLYLPLIGILLMLTQTVLFKKLTDRNLIITSFALCAVLSAVNYFHQKNFSDPFAFWYQASETSPHSAYATMMLGAREETDKQKESYELYSSEERKSRIKTAGENMQKSYDLFHKAYALNPKEKYLNYYYGVMLQKKDSILASEPYFLAEKNGSNYYECDFYLARVAMTKNDTIGAINYMKSYLKRDPTSPQANNNLLLMYFTRGQIAEAKALVAQMQTYDVPVPQEILQRLNAMH